ncbi:MAG: hypothetical protein KBT40_07215 [bacterium]|nr:hypothetical protein [Candidatus Minthenecus merdequi]
MNSNLRLVALIVTFLFTKITTFADTPPLWMDAEARSESYPATSYYTGFAVGETNTGEPLAKVVDRLKQTASGDLMASIRVTVQRVSKDVMTNINDHQTVSSKNVFTAVSTVSTGKAEIPGLQIETYVDANNHYAAAFAYVPIKGLAMKLQRQLMMQLSRVEVRLDEASGYLSEDNKNQARKSAESASELLSLIDDTRLTMIAVNNDITDEDLMTEEWRAAKSKLSAIQSELNRTEKVFLKCVSTKRDFPFESMLSGELSRSGCKFTAIADNAKWTIYIDVQTKPYNASKLGEYLTYFTYATATITVRNDRGEIILADSKKVKGGHTLGYDQAADDALRKLVPEVTKAIKSIMQL